MTSKSSYPSVPRGANTPRDVLAVVEGYELLAGQRGSGLDAAITRRDLVDFGWAKLRRTLREGGQHDVVPVDTDIEYSDQPTRPENFEAYGAFTHVLLSWDRPKFKGYAYTEIWRATTDDFGLAVNIASSIPDVCSDPVPMGSSFYYWIRFVNNQDDKGPLNDTSGTLAETAPDVPVLLSALSGAITSSQLASDLAEPIGRISDIDKEIAELDGEIKEVIENANTTNLSIANMVSNSVLETALGDLVTTATLTDNYYTLTEADKAVALSVKNLVSTTKLGEYTNTARLNDKFYTKTGADEALAESVKNLVSTTKLGEYTNTATLNDKFYTKTGADEAVAEATKTLSTEVGKNKVAVQQHAESINGLSASITFKIENNGAMSSYGLASTQNDDGHVWSEFLFQVDRLAILGTSDDDDDAVTSKPFYFLPAPEQIEGISVPAGLYLESAFIQSASITSAKIQKLAVDSQHVRELSADKINTGTLDAGKVTIAGVAPTLDIRSAKTGARMQLTARNVQIFDANGIRVKLGKL